MIDRHWLPAEERLATRWLQRMARGLLLLLGLALPVWAQAGFTITRTSAPVLYIDTGITPNLVGHYTAYQVTSSAAEADVWVGIGSFTGGVASLATNEDGIAHFGPMAAGETRTAYFYLKAGAASATAQGHTVSIYGARPPGTAVASSAFSLTTVAETIAASANKVTSTIAGPDPAGLGGVITLTVTGETGTIGSAGILSFTPASYDNWRADAYELFDASITLPSGTVLTNRLYTSGQSTGGTYTAVYKFRAVGLTVAPTSLSPVGYISSGTQIKHTSTSSFGALTPISPASNTVTLAKTVSPTAPNGGDTLTYTLRLTNSGSNDVSVDRLIDTLPSSPATPSFVAGSATWNGAALADPAASGNTLTWSGVFTVPAGASRNLTFQAVLPSTPGAYVNSAIGYIGTTQIDTTLSGSDNSPATATVTIGPDLTITKTHSGNFTQGQAASYALTVSNSGNAASTGAVTVTDTVPAGMTPSSASGTGWSCGIVGQTVTCTRSDALAAGASYPAITLAVSVSISAGTPLVNSASVSGGGDANTGNNSASDSTVVNTAPADMSVAITGQAASVAPGGSLAGTLVCTNAGPGMATSATCTATASAGATISVGTCTASSGSAAALPSGATLSCAFTGTAPGTAGGTDTAATGVTLSAATSAGNDSDGSNNTASVSATLIDAVNDSASLPATGGSVALLANDTLGTSAATPSNVTVTLTANGGITGASIDGSGNLVVPGSTPAGSYSVGYRICDASASSVCDTATVSVTVAAPADMAVAISGLPGAAAPGSTVTATVTCTNSGGTAATNASCSIAGLPAGASTACTPASPQATLAAGAVISCAVSYTAPANGSVTLSATTVADSDANAGNNSATGTTQVIDAVNDSASVSASGGTVVLLDNDTLGAGTATVAAVTVSITGNGGLSGASIDGSGRLVVPSGTAAGTYSVTYRICAVATPAACDTAVVTVTVATPADMGVAISGLPAYAAPGSTVTATVTCTNSGGTAATSATCAAAGLPTGASVTCTPSSPQATLGASASMSCAVSYTAPASGTITLSASTGATSDADTANNSASGSTAVIDANADSATVGITGGSVPLLGNDTLGGSAVSASTVVTTVIANGGLSGASIDASGGLVVPAATASGSYAVTYRICAVAAPAVCDTAVATITVSASAPADMAVAISGLQAYAAPGSTVTATITCTNLGGTAATNASCSASGLPAGASVVCTPTSPQASLGGGAAISCAVSFTAPANGVVTLSASTGATGDAVSSNNSASASTTVIDAVADAGTVAATGGSVALLANDTLGGVGASASTTSASITADGGLTGASIDALGQLVVPAGTPAGTYALTYRLCAVAAPAVCDTAVATITVTAPADMAVTTSGFPSIAAPGAAVTGTITCTNVGGSPALNATCGVAGLPAGATVSCTPASPQASVAAGGTIVCTVGYVAPASGGVTLTATAGASNDTNATNGSAIRTALVIDAVDDTASVAGTGGRVALLANDTLGGSAATLATTTVAVIGTWPAGLSLNAATGELVVAPGTPDGSYSVGYRLCAVASPSTCDSATVTLALASSNMNAVYSGLPMQVQPGQAVSATLTCTNIGNAAATNASCVPSGLPAGASVSCTPPSPQATLAPGSAIACAIVFTAPSTPGVLTLGAIGTASNDATPANDSTSASIRIADQRLDVVKSAGSPAYVQSGASSFDVAYRFVVKAQGTDAVPNVQLADSLARAFAAGSPRITVLALQVAAGTCTADPGFDGVARTALLSGRDTLAAGASCTITLRARVAYASPAAVPASDNGNFAYASGLPGAGPNPGHAFGAAGAPVAPTGAVALDISNDAAAPPATANGDNAAGSPTVMRLPVLAVVTGSVFVDANGNGRQDADETPKGRYLVQVVQPADPAHPENGSTLLPYLQAVTAPDGSYRLPGVPAGVPLALRFLPLAEGSGLTPETAVVAVPAGLSAVPVLGGTPVNGAPGVNTSTVAPTRAYLPLQIDPTVLTAGATVPNQSLPIDPSGVVYDSVSRLPVAGAIVQLQNSSGSPVPAGTLLPGTSDTVTTNADGVYAFLLESSAIPGSYRLAVTPPASHVLSTSILAAGTLNVPAGSGSYLVQAQSSAPTGAQPTTYHLAFDFTQPRDVVHNHIPLDPRGGTALFIDKQVDRAQAEIGDSVLYRIRLRNANAFAVPLVQVDDRLPLGFKLIAGSTRLTLANVAAAITEPTGAPGPALNFAVGTLAANSEAVLSYRVRIGIGADRGTGVNSARASSASSVGSALASRTTRATVSVSGGVFTRDACVIGKVYVDCNGNAMQDAGEPGIPGVRLVFEDGTALTTDINGQYSLCGVRATTHVLKVDPLTLPQGSTLGLTGSRNAGDAKSRFVDLHAGELHRADFREASCTPAVTQEAQQRRRRLETATAPDPGPPPSGVRFESSNQPTTGATK